MERKEFRAKIAALGKVSKAQRNEIACALIGHSRIVTACFGYIHCGRCEAQIADKLTGSYENAPNCVQVGHGCKTCRANYRKMDWRDKVYVPDPFAKKRKAARQ